MIASCQQRDLDLNQGEVLQYESAVKSAILNSRRFGAGATHPPFLQDQLRAILMSEFSNVTVTKRANLYFDGRVSSRTLSFPNGAIKTLGIMQPGEFEFTTHAREEMEILSGELEVLLPDAEDWQRIEGGETFEVPAEARFSVRVFAVTDYCCSFLD